MENPVHSVLSNDLILDNIFRHLPTPDLLLKVNRTASKWNKAVSKFVQFKRTIELTEKNFVAYSKFINNGGVGAEFINLRVNLLEHEHGLNLEDVVTMFVAFTKIGANVRNLCLLSSNWEINSNNRIQLETILIGSLLHGCKNIETLFLNISDNLSSNLYKMMDLDKLKPYLNLKSMWIASSEFNHCFFHKFLEAAPNIQLVNPMDQPDLQDLQRVESQFPTVLEKFGSLITSGGEQIANFLTNSNFSSINDLRIGVTGDFKGIEKVLGKYAHQFVKLFLIFGEVQNANDLETPQLFLPLMRNLETLTISFVEIGFDQQYPACRFVRKVWEERNFPKLEEFIMQFPYESTEDGDKRLAEDSFEQVCLAIFKYRPAHPVFPNVKTIVINAGERSFVGGRPFKIKPNVFKAIRWYFPNFIYLKLIVELDEDMDVSY